MEVTEAKDAPNSLAQNKFHCCIASRCAYSTIRMTGSNTVTVAQLRRLNAALKKEDGALLLPVLHSMSLPSSHAAASRSTEYVPL